MSKAEEIKKILKENDRRNTANNAVFNPITGEGALLERVKIVLEDFSLQVQYIPKSMMRVPLVRQLAEEGSIRGFLATLIDVDELTEEQYAKERDKVVEQYIRIRMEHDFCFFAALFIFIKCKGGGEDIRFRLTRPQRKLIAYFERRRLKGKPIRLVLLKARQWGGSTATQIYMAWLQLVHKVGLNSLIIAHQGTASDEIHDMFNRLILRYPVKYLHQLGEAYSDNEPVFVGVGKSGNIHRVPQRNCKIKIGTAERPDSCRGGDYNLVHLSEVGLWKKTKGKTPEDIVQSACSGIPLEPYTMIVYESTAKGTGNFFHREYQDAKDGKSQFDALFVAWWEIDLYRVRELDNPEAFATWLYENRENNNVNSNREEPGKYLWWLWTIGATLEAIQWYILERAKYADHGLMASEYPSDDIEAFVHSGTKVFDKYKVERLKSTCRPPIAVGDVAGVADEGKKALQNLHFSEDKQGLLWIWEHPEKDEEDEQITNRYLVVVDIGGRSHKADWSVIVVFDRYWMMEGDKPVVVAQWYGHIDHDMLAWKAAQIAAYYNNAYLVIESNTLETKDPDRDVDGDQSNFILNQIKGVYENLYARKQSESDILEGLPRKYGFHTNVATKPMVISTLVKVIREQLYVERDIRCIDEYLQYEKKQNGAFGAIDGAHDDLLMTRAIGLHICFFEMEPPKRIRRTMHRKIKRKAVGAATL